MKANKVSKINRLSIKVLALLCGIWSAAQPGFLPSAVGQPSAAGQWGPVLDWSTNYLGSGHNVAIHLVVLPTGKVIMYPYVTATLTNSPRLWDPTDNSLTTLPRPGYSIFCGAHSHIPDGRVLFTGGELNMALTQGEPKASYYNPLDSTWTRLPDMNGGRWYPTSTMLASGEVLVTSGFLESGEYNENPLPQVWNPAAGAWWDLTDATNQVPPLYTPTFLAPNGKVFFAMGDPGTGEPSRYLDATRRPFFNGEWSDPVSTPLLIGHNNPKNPVASACMDHAGTVYWFGGGLEGWGDVPIAACEKIDLAAATPAWTNFASMPQPRKFHNATILPNGKFLITGGRTNGEPADPENDPDPEVGGGKAALLYDPVANTWTALATEARYRGYHSTAVLLPDGTVLSASGDLSHDNNLVVIPGGTPASASAQVFSPPYLFNGTNLAVRPVISSAPSVAGYGETFFVGTPDAASITNVTLTRLSSTTHSFNSDQRINVLTKTQTSCGLNITAPANQTNCPPGYYMLWLINSNGVPSKSTMVRISKGLSGAFVFSCDTNGNAAGNFAWDTRGPDSDFYKIFVTQGTPGGTPDGLTNTFLNGPDWTNAPLSLKLNPGENKFTMFFQSGGSWTNFGMNLFFDDGIVGEISVKYVGGSISTNGANPTYTFTSYPYPDAPASGTLITGYGRRIELTEFSIAATNVYARDRVSSHDVGTNGALDYVGTFTLRVTDLTSDLVAHWRLNEASGNRVDAHAGIVLTNINGVGQGAGKVGNAASFSAAGEWPTWSEQSLGTASANGQLSMCNIDQSFTIAGWVNFTALEMTGLAGKWANGSLEYIVYTDGNNLWFPVSSNGVNHVSAVDSTALATNTWYFFCCWHDAAANTINISVNNNAPTSVAHSTGVYNGNASFYLGRNEEGGTWLGGRLDSISVWKRVLTSAERTRLYNAGSGLDYPF